MFYVDKGKLSYIYNLAGIHKYTIASTQTIPAGKHQVRMEFAYDGGGLAKGGTVTLYLDGKAVGNGRVDATAPAVFSADELSDVGFKSGSPMIPEMTSAKSHFTGTVIAVVIDISGEDTDHLLDREQVMNMIIARQ
jgi:arylsulfatase